MGDPQRHPFAAWHPSPRLASPSFPSSPPPTLRGQAQTTHGAKGELGAAGSWPYPEMLDHSAAPGVTPSPPQTYEVGVSQAWAHLATLSEDR